MKLDSQNISRIIDEGRAMLSKNKKIPAEFAALFSIVLSILELMFERFNKNSKNSSIPPSQDPNRAKNSKVGEKRKPGGQLGRVGKNLALVETPDEIIAVPVDRSLLPHV